MQTYFPGYVIKGRYGEECWGLNMITSGYNYEDTIDVGLKSLEPRPIQNRSK